MTEDRSRYDLKFGINLGYIVFYPKYIPTYPKYGVISQIWGYIPNLVFWDICICVILKIEYAM
jgi:hypothetical protein